MTVWSENSVTDDLDMISLLHQEFDKENYKKVIVNANSNLCYVFFSSNGLYCPNTIEEFEQKICVEDRYEWSSLSRKRVMKSRAGAYLFIRDLYKTWYINGINNEINSIEKLIDFVKKKTVGYRVVTVGTSSGGYIATLVGCAIGAEAVFNYSGQFDVEYTTSNFYYMFKRKDEEDVHKYLSLIDMVKKCDVPIFYLYPNGCDHDVVQAGLVKDVENVYSIAFDQNVHASTCYFYNMPYIMSYPKEYMLKVCSKIKNREPISQQDFYRISMKCTDRVIQNITNIVFSRKK